MAGRWLSIAVATSIVTGTVCSSALADGNVTPRGQGTETTSVTLSRPFRYVALGDSLSVGFEPDRSSYFGFADRLYEQALLRGPAGLTNDGINGLTSDGLRAWMDDVVSGKPSDTSTILPSDGTSTTDPTKHRAESMFADPESVRSELAGADLITVTIGGNDYLKDIFRLIAMNDTDRAAAFHATMATVDANITEVIKDLRMINPTARIRIADQYQPLWDALPSYASFEQLATDYTKGLDDVVASFNTEASSTGAPSTVSASLRVAYVAQAFVGKETEATHILQRDIHPTQTGYDLIADVFSRTIWSDADALPTIPSSSSSGQSTHVIEYGRPLSDKDVRLVNGTTYVAIRTLADAAGWMIGWDGTTRSVTLSGTEGSIGRVIGPGQFLRVQADRSQVTTGLIVTSLTPPVQIFDGRLFVPLRAMANVLGQQIVYVSGNHAVFLND